jgi:ethanolamine permease
MLWGLGVGYVISGEYFGWNLGLPLGGTYGLLLAFVLVTILYFTFVFSYAELACAMPRAGGVFVYANRGLGRLGGFLGGIAQAVEFVFAPPAIAMAIGAYISRWAQGWNPKWIAVLVYLLFTSINVWGVKQAAIFELVVTVLAVGELLLFSAVVAPHFELERFSHNAWPGGWTGAVAAIPYAIWFYLAIEGVANAAEEAKNPEKDVAFGFGSAILTLVVLAVLVFFLAVGVGGWEAVVYEKEALVRGPDGLVTAVAEGAAPSDSPLPLALGQVVQEGHLLYHLLVGVGLIGLVASFHGIILAAGRALFEMGRAGFLPRLFGKSMARTRTPANALLLNAALGVASILFFDTAKLITMSALGAVVLYVISMLALLRLRAREPSLPRPYRTPFYPWFPIAALAISAFCLLTMGYFNLAGEKLLTSPTVWYLGINLLAGIYYFLLVRGPSVEETAPAGRAD